MRIFFAAAAAAAFSLAFVPCAFAADSVTTLRVTGTSITYKPFRGMSVMQHGEATVQNVGTVTADKITVKCAVAGGKEQPMTGPDTLEPNKRGTYTWEASTDTMVKGAKLSATVTCANCRHG
jgi:hypothetical protein